MTAIIRVRGFMNHRPGTESRKEKGENFFYQCAHVAYCFHGLALSLTFNLFFREHKKNNECRALSAFLQIEIKSIQK